MGDVLKLPPLSREVPREEIVIRADDNVTRLSFPASSEKAVERWFGEEVLSHEPDAVRLDRAKRGAMPLLFNHNWDDPIGVIDKARVEGERLVVDAHLFDTTRAKEVGQMLAGGLRNVSIGYRLHVVEEDKKSGVFTARDWEPFEVSIVSVPADPTVGIGRQLGGEELEVRMLLPQPALAATTKKEIRMDPKNQAAGGGSAEVTVVDDAPKQATPLEMEQARRKGIIDLCKASKIEDRVRDIWISQGVPMEKVAEEFLQIMEERGKTAPQSAAVLGLTMKETQQFSLVRAISAVADKNWNQAGFEAECSRTIAQKLGRQPDPNKFYVPYEVQDRANRTPLELLAYSLMKRDLTVATAGAGGYLVETTNVGFIEMLRNRSVLFNMGARRLSGLVGNVSIPKQSVAATPGWLATEGASIPESQQTFVQVALAPKNVGGYTELSRQLLLQSNPSAEGIVMADLAAIVALDIDLKGLNGSGAAGQPTGIINVSGVGSVTGASLDYADIIEFQTDVFAGNALNGSAGYVTTGAVAGLLKQRVKFASTASPIWEGRLEDGVVDAPQGYRGMASNQMPSATMIFGDFGQVIVAEWGVLEVEVNPYANFQAGIIGVRAIASVDIAVRHATAFSVASSIT
jgi:HK97 family phage major capsid protein/HK97 family phage prohead protease